MLNFSLGGVFRLKIIINKLSFATKISFVQICFRLGPFSGFVYWTIKGKTPWTIGRIDKASDKVIDKVYDEYHQQPTETVEKNKIFDQEDIKLAQEVGEVCFPLIVELYAEGLSVIMQSMPYIKDKYKLNTEILRSKLEANNRLRVRISIKVGQKIVERFGTDAVLAMTVLRDTRSAISIINEDILKATVDSLELVEE